MAKKYYAIRQGRKTGIFTSWEICKDYVDGFKGAEYKSFKKYAKAKKYLEKMNINVEDEDNESSDEELELEEFEVAIYVDGSYDNETGLYSYGAVCLMTNEKDEIGLKKMSGVGIKYNSMRNVAGELAGVIQSLKWAINNGYKKAIIFHDYSGIAKWIDDEWKANEDGVIKYKEIVNELKEDISLEFVKVEAHSGIEYNEMADKLAGEELNKVNTIWSVN